MNKQCNFSQFINSLNFSIYYSLYHQTVSSNPSHQHRNPNKNCYPLTPRGHIKCLTFGGMGSDHILFQSLSRF